MYIVVLTDDETTGVVNQSTGGLSTLRMLGGDYHGECRHYLGLNYIIRNHVFLILSTLLIEII